MFPIKIRKINCLQCKYGCAQQAEIHMEYKDKHSIAGYGVRVFIATIR